MDLKVEFSILIRKVKGNISNNVIEGGWSIGKEKQECIAQTNMVEYIIIQGQEEQST